MDLEKNTKTKRAFRVGGVVGAVIAFVVGVVGADPNLLPSWRLPSASPTGSAPAPTGSLTAAPSGTGQPSAISGSPIATGISTEVTGAPISTGGPTVALTGGTSTSAPVPTATRGVTGPPPSVRPSAAPANPVSCPDQLESPPVVRTTQFTIKARITCPPPTGDSVYLVAEIDAADGQGNTEYYLVEGWHIDVHTTATQSWPSTVSKGVTRTYFLIGTTPADLEAIKNTPGNKKSDGGYLGLGGLQPVSNTQTTKQMP